MAPEGLGAAARSPTVLLYAAKKAERTSCSRVSRSLKAASLWRRRKGGRERRKGTHYLGAGSKILFLLLLPQCYPSVSTGTGQYLACGHTTLVVHAPGISPLPS